MLIENHCVRASSLMVLSLWEPSGLLYVVDRLVNSIDTNRISFLGVMEMGHAGYFRKPDLVVELSSIPDDHDLLNFSIECMDSMGAYGRYEIFCGRNRSFKDGKSKIHVQYESRTSQCDILKAHILIPYGICPYINENREFYNFLPIDIYYSDHYLQYVAPPPYGEKDERIIKSILPKVRHAFDY